MSELINMLLMRILVMVVVVSLLVLIPTIVIWDFRRRSYKKTGYYAMTKKSYGAMRNDVGAYGEYLLFKHLTGLPGHKRFLFNCYVPKDDGTTSEIDVILLHTSGIYVFESKNYSGWIFGTESQRSWTQSFPNGRKEKFYNPLMQNNGHMKWLQNYLPGIPEYAFRSIIVFSERCSLKKINLTTGKHKVINRQDVYPVVFAMAGQQLFSDEMIEDIFQRLYPLTQSTQDVRAAHINAIHHRHDAHMGLPAPTPVVINNQVVRVQNTIVTDPFNRIQCCNICGAEMTLQVVSCGEQRGNRFWGCSTYPKCRNTVNLV